MKNIVLTGMPGCGKSTIAKFIQVKLPNFKLIELDNEIEQQENCTINEIFKQKGEKYFREKETETLQACLKSENLIISLGGGTFESEENRKLLKQNCLTFFLDCSINVIFERIKNETQRPLLNTEAPLDTLKNLYSNRISNFKKADIKISANRTIEEISQEIIRIYNERTN